MTNDVIKLRGSDRERIVSAAVVEAIRDRVREIQERENALAVECMKALAERDGLSSQLEIARKLERSWIRTVGEFTVKFRGLSMTLTPKSVDGKPSPAVPWVLITGSSLAAEGELAERLLALYSDKRDQTDAVARMKARVEGLVGSVTTLGALAKLWPEGEKYYAFVSEREGAKRKNLPATAVAEVNQLLGLGSEKEKSVAGEKKSRPKGRARVLRGAA